MDEILKKLLESELLSEETKSEITEQFKLAVSAIKEEVALEVRAELAENYTKERDALIQNVDEKVTEMLADELIELKEDISRFRDLEVEYAEKMVTEKHVMAEKLSEELDELVDKIDAFLEYRISEEMTELKEDITVVRENEFGRKIFEAYMTEFNKSFVDEASVQSKLAAAEEKLEVAQSQITEMTQAKSKAERALKLDEILAPLTGSKRDQMSIILQSVETAKLQEAYNLFIGRIVKEVVKEEVQEPITESVVAVETKVVTGEIKEEVEVVKDTVVTESALQKTLRLAGVSK